MKRSDSSDDVIIESSQNDSKNVYSGAFSFLNFSQPPQKQISQPQILSYNQLSNKTKQALDPSQLCLFYQKSPKFKDFLFGPLLMENESEPYNGTFDISKDIINAVKGGLKAVMFCIMDDEPKWPDNFIAYINNHQINRPNPIYNQNSQLFWIDISKTLKLAKNSIQVTMSSENTGKYIFAIRMFNAPLDFNFIVEILKRPHLNFDDWKKIYKETIIDSDDVHFGSYQLSLICPLGLTRMKEPGRGVECKHLQCFDLTKYIKYVRDCGKWDCPICDQKCPFESLRIDDFVLDILQNAPTNCKSVEIDRDGKYVPIKIEDSDFDSYD